MLPWVLLALNVVQGADPIPDLIGIAAGHAYIDVRTVLPTSHGYRILNNLHPRAQKVINFVDYYYNQYFPQNRPRSNIWGQGGARVNPNEGEQSQSQNNNSSARFRAFAGGGVRLGGN